MSYSILDFLQLMGALGIFIFGMKIMSEGLQNAAGSRLRRILSGMTSTRVRGVLAGVAITTAIQSSSATTVMVISFVNAGLLTLGESLGVIMGANIGTTVTAWIVAEFGFKLKIVALAIMIAGVAFPFLFSKRGNIKYIAEFAMGFAILFIGLNFLKESVPDIKSNPQILEFLSNYTSMGFTSTLIFIGIGTLLTIIVQSSSASMAITLVMFAHGWIDFHLAAAMVLGENLGTTITANLAALVANVHAKRAARFHSFFNVIGIVWILFVFNYFLDFTDFIASNLITGGISIFGTDEVSRIEAGTLGLALFHTLFNVSNVLILFFFVPLLEKLVVRLQPSTVDEEEFRLQFISTGLMATPELSIEQAKKELQLFARILDKMCGNVMTLLYEEVKNKDKLVDKIKAREDITDRLEIEISTYLSSTAEGDLSFATSAKVRSMLRMITDMERVADIFYQMTINTERLRAMETEFADDVKKELNEVFDIISEGIKKIRVNMKVEALDKKTIDSVYETESKINKLRDEFAQIHYKRLADGKYGIEAGIIYLDFMGSLEKIGDHIVNINEAMVGLK